MEGIYLEKILDRLGVYDFIGVFCTGGIAIVSLFLMYSELYEKYNIIMNTQTVSWVFELIICYTVGVILQEISGVIEHSKLHILQNSKEDFEGNKVVDNVVEIRIYDKVISEIITQHSNEKVGTKKDERRFGVNYCEAYLNLKGKNIKSERMFLTYAISRSLAIFYAVLFGFSILDMSIFQLFERGKYSCLKIFIVFCLAVIFSERSKRYAGYMIRNILREYFVCRCIEHEQNDR